MKAEIIESGGIVSTIGGYREGILQTVDRLVQQQEESKEAISNRKPDPWTFPKETPTSSADYVVEWRSNKRHAQDLIDSGAYSGEQLEKLKSIATGPDDPPTKDE